MGDRRPAPATLAQLFKCGWIWTKRLHLRTHVCSGTLMAETRRVQMVRLRSWARRRSPNWAQPDLSRADQCDRVPLRVRMRALKQAADLVPFSEWLVTGERLPVSVWSVVCPMPPPRLSWPTVMRGRRHRVGGFAGWGIARLGCGQSWNRSIQSQRTGLSGWWFVGDVRLGVDRADYFIPIEETPIVASVGGLEVDRRGDADR